MSLLVVAIPMVLLAGATVLGVMALAKTRGALIPDRLASLIGCGASATAFVLGIIAFVKLRGERLVVTGHEWIAAGELSVRIDKIFPLAEAAAAHQYIEERKTKGKLLLIP